MSYNPVYETSKALPVEHIAKQLEDFAASGQDLSRRRFSRSPPRVRSVASTTYGGFTPASPHTQLQTKERKDMSNSTANSQFEIQIRDEIARLRIARDKGLLQHVDAPYWRDDAYCWRDDQDDDWRDAAKANVQYRWLAQGIWDEGWSRGRCSYSNKTWRHESRESPSPVEPSMEPSKSVEDGGETEWINKMKRRYSEVEREYDENVRCANDLQNRQLSRPCFQFVYQSCQEREWIRMGVSEGDQDQHASLDMRAYEKVKSRWIRDGIWDDDWAFLPGTTWKHERPGKIANDFYQWTDACNAARLERAERLPRWYFMAPILETRRTPVKLSPPPDLSEGASDWSSRCVSRPASEGMQSLGHRSAKSQTPEPMLSLGSSRKSTVKATRSTKGLKHVKPQGEPAAQRPNPTRIKTIGKGPPRREVSIPHPCVTKSKPVKRTSANSLKNQSPSSAARRKETMNYDTPSRPRRAAAISAMENLRHATRR